MKVFIDVDNTILEHSGFYSIETESRIHSSIGKFPKENSIAIRMMYDSAICRNPDIINELLKLDFVYILTKYPAIEYEIHKQRRVAKVLGISHDELMNLTDKEGHKKYIFLNQDDSKVEVVKNLFNLNSLDDCVLIDDYSTNLIEWSNNKGVAIKYFNEYNSAKHPRRGLSISNFKIFGALLKNKPFNELLISCEDTYMLNTVLKSFDSSLTSDKLDIIREVYYDLKSRLNVNSFDINSKYNLRNFLIEYYRFQDSIDVDYWSKVISEKREKMGNVSMICSSFDVNYKKLNLFSDDNNLTVKILENSKPKTTNIYDVYLTLDSNAFVDNIDYSLKVIISLLERFLLVNK